MCGQSLYSFFGLYVKRDQGRGQTARQVRKKKYADNNITSFFHAKKGYFCYKISKFVTYKAEAFVEGFLVSKQLLHFKK